MRDALPNASFIGFTGTPIELADASTRAVFGDHISVYDIQRAVEDGATVPIYYESRLARLGLDERERPTIDAGFEEVTEGEEVDRREKLKTKWAQLEAIVGAEKRVALVARDIVEHFEGRQEAMDGKAMVVCMSRRICIDLYRELARLRPAWRAADPADPAADSADPAADSADPAADSADPSNDPADPAADPGSDSADPAADSADPGNDSADPAADSAADSGDPADDSAGALKVVMTGKASDSGRLAAAHPQQGAPRGAGQALP